jgi:ubiquitin-conjugating enzyme E2 A
MSTIARRKLLKDMKEIDKEPIPGIFANSTESLLVWDALIYGPEDTIWEGGIFRLSL